MSLWEVKILFEPVASTSVRKPAATEADGEAPGSGAGSAAAPSEQKTVWEPSWGALYWKRHLKFLTSEHLYIELSKIWTFEFAELLKYGVATETTVFSISVQQDKNVEEEILERSIKQTASQILDGVSVLKKVKDINEGENLTIEKIFNLTINEISNFLCKIKIKVRR